MSSAQDHAGATVTADGIQPGYAYRFLSLLIGINLLNYIDRAAVSGLLEPIRKEFGATDAQMGMVGLAFLATYALLPPVFGWLGDRMRRTRIIASSIVFWCVATAAAGLTRSVGALAATRAAVGVGEASYMANAPSLIADLFPLARRGRAMSLFYTASPIGAAVGVALAGVLAAAYGWRAACFLVGLPGIAVAYVMYRMREPRRGAAENITVDIAPPFRDVVAQLLRNRAFIFITLAYAGQVFAQNAIEFWLPTVLQRDKAIPIAQANATYGFVVLIAGLVGPLLGAFLADAFLRRTRRSYYHVCAASAALTCVPLTFVALTYAPTALFASIFFEVLLGNMAVGLAVALAVTVVLPNIRASATAILITSVHVLGDVISQPLVGKLSTAIESGAFPQLLALFNAAETQHLSVSLVTVATPAAILAGVFYMIAARQPGAFGPEAA